MAAFDEKNLVAEAVAAAKQAYAPYSNYHVGAVLVAEDGTHYTGCNVENAAYSACICAERTALVKAISEGQRDFSAIAVATENGGSPCGVCRQMLYEFSPDLKVIIGDFSGEVLEIYKLSELLRDGFGPSSLTR